MFEGVGKALKQFGTVFMNLPTPKKMLVMTALVVVVAGFAGMIFLTGRPDFQVLYSNLSQEDAAQVVDKLKEMRIPYRLAAKGTAIEVPAEQLFETRLSLAGQGLPQGAGIGFEVFDESKVGATEFVQRINYQRAIQGELARTINQFKEVVSSRVHIVTPRERLFIEEQKQPSAAVVLQLKDGAKLSPTQVQAVVNLVAGSVEGLVPERVSLVDTNGRVLYDKKDQSQLAGLTQTQMEHKRKIEADLVAKVQSLLDRVLGGGKSIAKVSVDLDFDREKLVQEEYDPDGAVVRSSQSSEEEQEGIGSRAQGSPDEQFKVTGQTAGGQGGDRSRYSRTNETLNFEINKISRQVVKAAGDIKRLSAAVIIDGRYEEKTGPDGQPVRTYVDRTEEELARFTSLIRSALGYNEQRGDVVEVSSMPFETVPLEVEPAPSILDRLLTFAQHHARTGLVVLLAALFFFLVARPMLRWSGKELKEALVETKKLPEAEGELAGELEDLRRKMGPRERAALLAEKEPDLAVEVFRSWLHEAPAKR
ncbi:MAG: flagellar M-ring protein FliF [Deltaproteobacteria bacterium]|nr:flagellar M-ring protein FliF [Deltaproteobacteria bacterium]